MSDYKQRIIIIISPLWYQDSECVLALDQVLSAYRRHKNHACLSVIRVAGYIKIKDTLRVMWRNIILLNNNNKIFIIK